MIQEALVAGNLVCGANGSHKYYQVQLKNSQEKLRKVNVLIDALEKEDSLSPEQQEKKEKLIKIRSELQDVIQLLEGLVLSNKALMTAAINSAGTNRISVFDAPDSATRQPVDNLADTYGYEFEKKYGDDVISGALELLRIDESLDAMLKQPCYRNILEKEIKDFKKEIPNLTGLLKSEFEKTFHGYKLEYVGLRKGLRGKDWLVFRIGADIGDIGYHMIPYELDDKGALQLGPVFLPASGEDWQVSILSGVKKIFDEAAGIPNQTYSIPKKDLSTLAQYLTDANNQGIIDFFDQHSNYLNKNIVYDTHYITALNQVYSGDLENTKLRNTLEEATDTFHKQYPENILPDIMSIAIYLQSGDEERFLLCLNHMREAVINDPMLYWQESLFYFIHGDPETGLAKAREAKEKGYRKKEAYEALLDFIEDGSDAKEQLQELINSLNGDAKLTFIPNG